MVLRPRGANAEVLPVGETLTLRRWRVPQGGWTAAAVAAFVLLFHAAFYGAWPFIFVAVAPLACVCVSARRAWQAVGLAWGAAAAVWTWNEWFLTPFSATGVMVLAVWQGLTVALALVSARWWHRRWHVPLTWALPANWVAAEYLRMLGPLGLPIGPLALCCHGQLWMVQVADLGGLYALSFPIGMVNGLVADWWRARTGAGKLSGRALIVAGASTVAVWVGVAGYGAYRLAEAPRAMRPGPVVSVVQPDVVYGSGIAEGFDPGLLLKQLQELSEIAARQTPPPSLIVWPEAIGATLDNNPELTSSPFQERRAAALLECGEVDGLSPEERAGLEAGWRNAIATRQQQAEDLAAWVAKLGVPVLLGSRCWLPQAGDAGNDPWVVYNSAVLVRPDDGPTVRQSKRRLFPLFEWLPWPGTPAHRRLRAWLADHVGIPRHYSLTPGQTREIFSLPLIANQGPRSRTNHLAAPLSAAPTLAEAGNHAPPTRCAIALCSETLFPQEYPPPRGAGQADGLQTEQRSPTAESSILGSGTRTPPPSKSVDLLLCLSNPGGFQRNWELPFQFSLLVFRAVEERIAVVQSANTGISGFVKPTGEVFGLVTNAAGQAWTGQGAPELPAIAELVAQRNEQAPNPSPEQAELLRQAIQRIEQLRERVGVVGQSTQSAPTDTRHTLYSQTHDVFAQALLAMLLIGLAGAVYERRQRGIITAAASTKSRSRALPPR